jgi:glycyl-tRNA synthetase
VLVVLLDAYDEEETVDVNGKPDTRTVLRLAPVLAPFKAAVLPLMKKPELTDVARPLFQEIQQQTNFVVDYDETANIGKRYRRQDEIGTPFCFTVDYESLDDKAVTVRHRDTMEQERIAIVDVPQFLRDAIR